MINKLIYIVFIITNLFAQIQQGGSPKFYNNQSNNLDYIIVDSSKEINREFHPMVFQFGYEYEFNLDILEESLIIEDNDESTFIIGIESRGAYGIGLSFSEFYLTENSKLFLYDEERTFKLGALNSDNNKPSNSLTTSIIKGDRIIIELTVPSNEVEAVSLKLSSIIHDGKKSSLFNSSASASLRYE